MDSQKKRVLILHASAGHGHHKAAKAIEAAFIASGRGDDVVVEDGLDYFPPALKKSYVDSYLYSIQHAPLAWKLSYELTDCGLLAPVTRSARFLFNRIVASRLEERILNDELDLIYCTHFMSAEVLAHLKRSGKLRAKSVTVVTDFLVHRFWAFGETDHYTGAAPATRAALVKLGIPEDRITVTGIPVDPKFAVKGDRAALAEKHRLRADALTVLFTSGGFASGPFDVMIQDLCRMKPHVQIVVVCGNNQVLLDKLRAVAVRFPQVKPFGFVNFMDELMDCSDAIVGKAGGLTLSESLAKEKPFFVLKPVPGQEAFNMKCLLEANAGFHIRTAAELAAKLGEVIESPAAKERLVQAIRGISHPHAARAVMQAGLKLVGAA